MQKGVIVGVVEKNCELLVEPAGGGRVYVSWFSLDDENGEEVQFMFDGETVDSVMKEHFKSNPPDDCVVCFPGDIILFQKSVMSDQLEMKKLVVKKGDPREGQPNVVVE